MKTACNDNNILHEEFSSTNPTRGGKRHRAEGGIVYDILKWVKRKDAEDVDISKLLELEL